jgi:hypothetical protein
MFFCHATSMQCSMAACMFVGVREREGDSVKDGAFT